MRVKSASMFHIDTPILSRHYAGMMSTYTKLFSAIVASTLWREDNATRLVWITIIALADRSGRTEGSIPGLADLARVSLADCEHALEKLMAPDPYSRSKDEEGRRIKPIDGGWQIVNHRKYRDRMSADQRREYNRLKQQESRQRRVNEQSARVNTRRRRTLTVTSKGA